MRHSLAVSDPPVLTTAQQPADVPPASRKPQPLRTARPDSLYHVVLLALCAGTILLAFILSIRGQSQVVLPLVNVPLPELCMSRRMFGASCPGCGLTRSFIALARGDLAAAWSFNPAGLLLFAITAFQIPFRLWQLSRIRRGLPEIVLSRSAQIALTAFAVLLIAQWALRQMGVAF